MKIFFLHKKEVWPQKSLEVTHEVIFYLKFFFYEIYFNLIKTLILLKHNHMTFNLIESFCNKIMMDLKGH